MIHAELSTEARTKWEAMRRNTTISSIVIAFLTVALLLLVLGYFTLAPYLNNPEVIITYNGKSLQEEVIENPKVNPASHQKPSAPASTSAKVIAATINSNIAIPIPEIESMNPTMSFGDGDDFGDGINGSDGGIGPGNGQGNLPPGVRKRCSKADRLQRLSEMGGNEECEEAVLKALRWMQKNQAADGSFPGAKKSAMTGLALLAYLGHCETPLSEEFGDTVLKAIVYLVNLSMANDGKCADNFTDKHWPYEHAICVYALSEATTFCKQLNIAIPNLEQATQKSGQFLIDNQHSSGGWEYAYDESNRRGGDVSIVGWHIQALKAMKHTDLDFKNLKLCVKKGLNYLESKQDDNGGFGYSSKKPNGSYYALTGVGVLCFQMWDKPSSSQVRKGVNYIANNTKLDWNGPCDLYAHYYEAQAMLNRGGKDWQHYNAIMRDTILKNQSKEGTWLSKGHGAGLMYHTALCTLMLEVYYRFLPSSGHPIH